VKLLSILFFLSIFIFPSTYARERPNNYIHDWVKFPELKGDPLDRVNPFTAMPKMGEVFVVFFVASWCVPCQSLMDELRAMERTYVHLPVKFVYVFSHDTLDDAKAFAKEHTIDKAMLANVSVLKNFHNPELPSAFVSDRQGLLQQRFLGITKESLQSLQQDIALQLAF
jgi:thiol-disulfide isomerase/thioredoxin